MKEHTTIGANTLKEVYQNYPNNHFIRTGIEIAQSHHEKWDGSGYPEALSEDDIPLSARIMALVDVYDALRSKRVYKEAYSHEKTREIITQGRGNHFDPLIVDEFLACDQEFKRVYEQHEAQQNLKWCHCNTNDLLYGPIIYESALVHGPKRVFPYRFNAQERAILGGMYGVGIGALLGLGIKLMKEP